MANAKLANEIAVNGIDYRGGLTALGVQLTSVETVATSEAGNTTVAEVVSKRRFRPNIVLVVNPAAGAGTYTSNLILSTEDHVPGDSIEVVVNTIASANPTIVFKSGASDGDTVLSVANG